jgi:hypothetical protein
MRREAEHTGLHLSANCSPNSPASRKPSCSTTTAPKAVPEPNACSPTPIPSSSNWPTCSTSTAAPQPADRQFRDHRASRSYCVDA